MSGGSLLWRAAFTLAALLLIYSAISILPSILHSPLTCTEVNIKESNTPSQKSRTTHSNLSAGTISLAVRLREIESTLLFYSPDSHPLMVVKDISYGRYYALRDLQGWTLGYQNFSFEVVEQSFRTQVRVSDFSVFLCLGIHSQDRHCIKPTSLRLLRPTQKYNQIHGTRDILWRKDAYCYTMREALATYRGSKNFTFPCWVLPKDREKLEAEMSRGNLTRDWIVKPCGQGEGHGIFIVNTYDEIATRPQNPDGFVIQPLLTDPFLVNGKKFDFRTYVLVTSMSPLRVYIYKEGLVRFASSKYNKNATRGGSEQQYLTNTSIGKKYTNLANLTWTFQKLRSYFESNGVDSRAVFESLNEAIVRTLLSAEFRYLRNFMQNLGGYDCHSCFQLLGVDVILDSKLGPKVIEVNGLPSMQLSHELGVSPNPASPYTATKFGLMHDLLQILYKPTSVADELSKDLSTLRVGVKPGALCDPELHVFCIDHKQVVKLIDAKREYLNKGGYRRIYPSPDGEKYSKHVQHMDALTRKKLGNLPLQPRTLWQMHHLYTALEKLNANSHQGNTS